MEIGGVAIYRVEVQPVSGSGNFHSFPLGRTRQQQHQILMRGPGGLEVACLLGMPKVAASTSTEVDRFSSCENRRHACHEYVACKRSLEYQFGSGTLGKNKSRQYLAFDKSLN
ncbi:hypothetical protein TNCV_2365361 [Trichonephila clavipes]|nr:hypothetical protein TNCV_2365361 [Trichonephila clavipes]